MKVFNLGETHTGLGSVLPMPNFWSGECKQSLAESEKRRSA
jgi:hypothetical protein